MQVLCYVPNSVDSISHIDLTNEMTKSENVYHLNHKNNMSFGNKVETLKKISIIAFITLILRFNLLFIMLVEYFHTGCITINSSFLA